MRPQPRYQPGDKIGGRYQVHQALMGGMGEVYLCLDLKTIQPLALKTFQQRYLTNPKLREAFNREVATWVALEKHPNIVRCFYMDTLDNQPFMILEWIASDESRGTDLRSWLRYGPLDLRLALDFTIDICRGLIYAQEKQPGIVHRDLKPENILVAQERLAKITDFGLAKIVQEAELEITDAERETDGRQSLLGQGGIVGTPPYMAPEQWRGEALDARTDIYAVGCILYELLIGNWPFQATTIDDFRRQHLAATIPKLADRQPLPSALDVLLTRCLAKRREERFVTSGDLLQQLTLIYRHQFSEPPEAPQVSHEFTSADYNNRGLTFHKLQRYEEALADFDQAIWLDTRSATFYNNRGTTYEEMQRYEEALADYDRAIQLDLSDAYPHSNRGLVYHRLQRYEEALADFSRAIQLDPTHAKAFSNRGALYRDLQRYEEALADHNRSIQLDLTNAASYSNRGATYGDLQQYEEALADFSRAIQLDPTFPVAYINRGNTYARLQRLDEALADFDRAIQLDPNDARAYASRGGTYAALQRYDDALADLTQATQLDSDCAIAYFNIGVIFGVRGKLHEALPYLEKAAQLGVPQGAQYADQARQILAFETFQEAGSADEIQRAVAEFPFMTDTDFIAAVEQAIAEQVPPERQPAFEQRLAWLRQIANEQK